MTRETISIVTCGFFSPLLLSSDHFARSGGELFSRTQTPNQTQPFASVLFSASESVQNASVIGGAFRTLIIYTLVVRIVSCFCCLQPAAPRRPQRASSPNRFFIRCWRNMTRNFNKYPPQKKKVPRPRLYLKHSCFKHFWRPWAEPVSPRSRGFPSFPATFPSGNRQHREVRRLHRDAEFNFSSLLYALIEKFMAGHSGGRRAFPWCSGAH